MARLSLALLGAMVSSTTAMKWIGIQDSYTVGQTYTITWDMEGEIPGMIVLQHEEVRGFATDQYETLIRKSCFHPSLHNAR